MEVVEEYMGLTPLLQEAYMRRNFPSPYRTMNHYWHRDLNHQTHLLKAFLFLTDCHVENGPHEFVSGSHTDLTLNGKRYYSDHEVESYARSSNHPVIKSVVKAGTVILEDTRGLHRAVVPMKGYRDLGFAVFAPFPWYRPYRISHYQISSEVYQALNSQQKKFIPASSVIK
jgi:hypothetical protein